MEIEVICTGDEVLTGKIVNTNFSYIAQKLEDFGFTVRRGITVGDDREALLQAFNEAGERSDAVIVNGGLGPTVDDLSQEVAAQAAGVGLVLNEGWVQHMRDFFARRGRTMPDNNTKQAMLPETAEMLDNPVGTACGFAVTIRRARFFFTPGVPRELHRMLEHEIVPRLLDMSGLKNVIVLKRFHCFGLGESHVDQLLTGLEELVADGSLKLGFRAHYPQLEVKLTVRGATDEEVRGKLEPVVAEVHKRLGNFILAEDDDSLEGVVLRLLSERGATLAVAEDFTGGQLAARLAPLQGAERVFRRGASARDPRVLHEILGLSPDGGGDGTVPDQAMAERIAAAVREQSGAAYGLAVLTGLDGEADQISLTGGIHIAVATGDGVEARQARLAGGRDWIRLGAVEMGLDCLRRHLRGLPLAERIDFERGAEQR